MPRDADRDYHMQRAAAELDLAYQATRYEAAQAHLRLSALHLARLREMRVVSSEERASERVA